MDIFSRNRTFLVIFGFVVLFTLFLFHYFLPSFSETFTSNNQYPTQWNDFNPIYINNSHPVGDPNRHSITKKKFERNVTKESCHDLCHKQGECVSTGDDWNNKCEPSFVNDQCYCPFKKVAVQSRSNPGPDFYSTITRIFNQLPANLEPSWDYSNTLDKWTSVVSPTANEEIPWKNINASDVNNMAFSFWIYFRQRENRERKKKRTIFMIKSRNGKRLVEVYALPERPVINIELRTGKNTFSNLHTPYTHNVDMTDGHEIGYNHKAVMVIISIVNSVVHVYFDGQLKSTFGGDPMTPLLEDANLYCGSSTLPDDNSIYWKDFKIYNHNILENDIRILYREKQTDGYIDDVILYPDATSRSGFQNMFSHSAANMFSTYIAPLYSNSSVNAINEGFLSPIIVNDPQVNMNDMILRSETDKICTRDVRPSFTDPNAYFGLANYQNSPYNDSLNIDKATVYFKDNTTPIDFTNEVQTLLNVEPNRVGVPKAFGTTSHKMTIDLVHPWTKTKKSFDIAYDLASEFKWSDVVDRVRCMNSDDTLWNDRNTNGQACKDVGRYCDDSAPRCIHHTVGIRYGKCSKDNVIKYKTTSIERNNGEKRNVRYTELNATTKDYLELSISETKEKEILFTKNGTTIMFWVKINPEKRKRSLNECRLLNFGNRHWRDLEDEIKISVDGDITKDSLIFKVGDYEDKSMISQILDNKWHHIAWVLKPSDGTNNIPAQWMVYHNGTLIGKVEKQYPENKVRKLKMVGASGVDWDDAWGPSIGEFYIFARVLDENVIRSIYMNGIQE
jgi:hypothetical protein